MSHTAWLIKIVDKLEKVFRKSTLLTGISEWVLDFHYMNVRYSLGQWEGMNAEKGAMTTDEANGK